MFRVWCIIGFCVLFALNGCADVFDWSGAKVVKLEKTIYRVTALKTGRLSVTSGKPLDPLIPNALCTKRQSVIGDGAEALSCKVAVLPFELDVKSDGEVLARVLN
jgi:hypothetical protein